jgi:hypothetical protein
MNEPHEKYYEVPLGEAMSEEEFKEMEKANMKILKELTEAYAKTKASDSERFK